jgi:enoyl-CoA hydratase
MTDFEGLQLSREGEVAMLRLNRPQQRNALSRALRDALVDALNSFSSDDSVKAVVLIGAGDSFCAGFDLKELSQGDAGEIFHQAQGYHHQVHTFGKPLLAAINGPAVAGGMDLASMCDLRLAVRSARFGQPQVILGIPAAWQLTRSQMLESMARRICLTGDLITAEEACAAGYVSALFDDAETLEAGAMDWAGRMAQAAASGTMKQQILDAQPEIFQA